MKPKKLTLSAWGPYAGEESIDFEQFGSGGLFLLTGPTGSGKTMIFDGISYAVFGALSGRVREKDTLRSDFADERTETFVRLSFSHRDKTYEICRWPRCVRKKKRGEGEVTTPEKAALIMPDGKVIENQTAVNKKVVEILGVNHEQFKQIAMIAQGEFLDLLIADSKKRVEIFRDIFKTGVDNRIQMLLSEKVKALQRQIGEEMNKTEEAFAGIVCAGHEKLEFLLRQENRHERQILEALKEAVKADEKALASLSEQYETKNSAYRLVQSLGDQYQKNEAALSEAKMQLTQTKKRLEESSARQRVLEETRKQIPAWESERAARQEQFNECGRLLKKLAEADEQKTAVKAAEKAYQNAQTAAKTQSDLEKQCHVQYQENAEKIESGESIHEIMAALNEQKHQNAAAMEKCQQLMGSCKSYAAAAKYYRTQAALYQTAQQTADQKKQTYEREELHKRQSAAGLLAQTLKEGKPCPVCGALHHPMPAKLAGKVVTDEALDQMKQESEAASQRARRLLADLTSINKEKEIRYTAMAEGASAVLGIKTPLTGTPDGAFKDEKTFYEAVWQQWQHLSAEDEKILRQIKEAQKQQQTLEKLRRQQKELSGRMEKLRQTALEAAERASAAQADVQKQQALLERMNEELQEAGNKETLLKMQHEAKAAAGRLEKQIEDTQKQFQQLQVSIAADEERQKILQETKDKLLSEQGSILRKLAEKTDGAQIQVWLGAQRRQLKEIQEQRDQMYHAVSSNQRIARSVQEKLDKTEKLSGRYGMIKDLENAARGNNPKRLEFEQYVLGAYFDEILSAANLRLEHMSEGRYQLYRTEKVKDLRRTNSLDIEVLDHYTGKRRPVKSLSGGESFKAALSLALGLSDVVQSYVGGIDIELLFIDEGFGSLDEASVQTAVDTLIELSGKRTMIGIISHVSELKERIDRQIIVEKGVYGSTIKER